MFKREYGQGRRKLLEAVTRLAAREGHTRFSLRELAKEAGLGHNSLYRHFNSVDDMIPELMEDFSQELREGLRQARKAVPPGQTPALTVVSWLLDFALLHRDVFILSMRQRVGPPSAARTALEGNLKAIRQDMLSELGALGHLPTKLHPRMDWALEMVIDQSFRLCIEYIEHPDQREDILVRAQLSFAWVIGGALAPGAQSR
ncbi:MAG: TetR family transcriptional regulator [Aquabacterium sp.]|uniref:TetR family transcriptional regulator n=1 Tax=Aquabacterium sp. TaxID=1872578 RepID=UPI0027254D23|nr:TetR family transcriptional regulator [Aquabacterium sp.]MDO9001989.1 TetR family transcriptional regulator [Aquabacterium sp.]